VRHVMEKEKRQPETDIKSSLWKNIVYLVLSIPLICIVIFSIIIAAVKLPIYYEAVSVKYWDVPSETEIIDFETEGFSTFEMDVSCSLYARLYLASNHSKSYLEDFYRESLGDSINPHLWVSTDENLQLQYGRPVYVVIVRWCD
jgi:hypothetical protein